jgi:cytosine deaminase
VTRIPKVSDLVIRNARLIEQEDLVDITLRGNKIVDIGRRKRRDSTEYVDADGKLTLPGFIDSHMHLDKAMSGGEKKWTTNTCIEARKIQRDEKPKFTLEDVKERARKAVEMALTNGTTAIRTHVDIDGVVGLMPLKALLELKDQLSNWMNIQVVAFPTEPLTTSKTGKSLLRKAMMMGADVVGGVPVNDPDPKEYVDSIFSIAKEFEADIDLHIDECNDPKDLLLEYYAEKTLKNRYQGKVSASHCSSLSAVGNETALRIIRKVRDAEISIIVNPLTNLYLWSGNGRPNGVSRVRELLDEGITVAYATDNTMDPFNPLGNADMLLAALFLAYLKHLGNGTLTTVLEMGTNNPARITKMVQNYGIKKGGRADIMILDALNPQEAITRQAKRLYVFKNGRIVAKGGVLTVESEILDACAKATKDQRNFLC